MQKIILRYLMVVIVCLVVLNCFNCSKECAFDSNKNEIKEIAAKVERGIIYNNPASLDSVCTEGVGMSQKILDGLHSYGRIGKTQIVEREVGYHGDKKGQYGEWEIDYLLQGERKNDTIPTLLFSFYLEKKANKWKVQGFNSKIKVWKKTDGKMINIDNFDRY